MRVAALVAVDSADENENPRRARFRTRLFAGLSAVLTLACLDFHHHERTRAVGIGTAEAASGIAGAGVKPAGQTTPGAGDSPWRLSIANCRPTEGGRQKSGVR